jgi:hypothetical protein
VSRCFFLSFLVIYALVPTEASTTARNLKRSSRKSSRKSPRKRSMEFQLYQPRLQESMAGDKHHTASRLASADIIFPANQPLTEKLLPLIFWLRMHGYLQERNQSTPKSELWSNPPTEKGVLCILSHSQPRAQLETRPRYSILACVLRQLPRQAATDGQSSPLSLSALMHGYLQERSESMPMSELPTNHSSLPA